jgi:hypothetical protein
MKETQFEYHLQVEQESENWIIIDSDQNIKDLIYNNFRIDLRVD